MIQTQGRHVLGMKTMQEEEDEPNDDNDNEGDERDDLGFNVIDEVKEGEGKDNGGGEEVTSGGQKVSITKRGVFALVKVWTRMDAYPTVGKIDGAGAGKEGKEDVIHGLSGYDDGGKVSGLDGEVEPEVSEST